MIEVRGCSTVFFFLFCEASLPKTLGGLFRGGNGRLKLDGYSSKRPLRERLGGGEDYEFELVSPVRTSHGSRHAEGTGATNMTGPRTRVYSWPLTPPARLTTTHPYFRRLPSTLKRGERVPSSDPDNAFFFYSVRRKIGYSTPGTMHFTKGPQLFNQSNPQLMYFIIFKNRLQQVPPGIQYPVLDFR